VDLPNYKTVIFYINHHFPMVFPLKMVIFQFANHPVISRENAPHRQASGFFVAAILQFHLRFSHILQREGQVQPGNQRQTKRR
jgi:hypothetical protein